MVFFIIIMESMEHITNGLHHHPHPNHHHYYHHNHHHYPHHTWIETLNRGPVRERMHKDLVRTLNSLPSFAGVGPKLPMEMDDTKMHSIDHFSVVEKKHTGECMKQRYREIRL